MHLLANLCPHVSSPDRTTPAPRPTQPRRMRLAAQLWSAGIRAEFGYKANPKMPDQVSSHGCHLHGY